MIAVYCCIALLGVLIFMLGRWAGKLDYESTTRQRIKSTGFFMLDNGFYRAVRIGIDTNKPQPVIEPNTLPDVSETWVIPETALPADTTKQPEPIQPARKIRRRISKANAAH